MSVLREPIASVVLGATLLSSALPAQANDNCNLIKAFTSKDGKGLRQLSIATTRDGTFDILVGKDPTVARAADSCEIDGPLSSFELRCEWDFEGLQSRAEQKLELFKTQLAPCLTNGWEVSGSTYNSESYRILTRVEATLTNSNDEEVDVQLSVSEFIFDGTPSYDFDLAIER